MRIRGELRKLGVKVSATTIGQPGLHKQLSNGVHRLLRAVVHWLLEVEAVQHRANVDTDRTVRLGVVASTRSRPRRWRRARARFGG